MGSNVGGMVGPILHEGQYQILHATMVDLIGTAYSIDVRKVFGGPSWMESDHFDVVAKTPSSTAPETAKVMLQGLLADRFKLKTHYDNKPLPVYVLTTGSGQPKLKESTTATSPGCERSATADRSLTFSTSVISCHNATMGELTEQLQQYGGGWLEDVPVMDLTKLEGQWDFTLRFVGNGPASAGAAMAAGGDATSLFDAISKQLGLKLERQSVSMPVIVVDKVNESPDNPTGARTNVGIVPSQFEVADVKPLPPNSKDDQYRIEPGGRFEASGSLKDIIGFAFNIDPRFRSDMIVGAPKWVELERFHIVAKPPDGLVVGPGERGLSYSLSLYQLGPTNPHTLAAVKSMVRALLTDRFKLTTHTEDRQATVYVMIAPKGDGKLKIADNSERAGCQQDRTSAPATSGALAERCLNTTMSGFAQRLNSGIEFARYFDHPVVDATGIRDGRDFLLIWNRDPGSVQTCVLSEGHTICTSTPRQTETEDGATVAPEPGEISIFQALEQELGLKIEKQKHAVPVIVIDHVARPRAN